MDGLIVLGLFILGTIFASLIGVVVGRLYTGASIALGRSRCDSCGETLSGFDLVPLVSWLLSLGRCRYCSSRVSAASTLSELGLGVFFVLAYLRLGLGVPLVLFCISLTLLLAIVLYDLAHSIIPPRLLWPFVCGAALFAYVSTDSSLLATNAIIAMAIGTSLALVHLFSAGRAMGLSDAPPAFGLALLTGAFAFSGFVFSFWIGAVVGIVILLRTPAGTRMGREVPFAPFLAAGFLLAYFSEWDPFSIVSFFVTRTLGG